MPLKRRQIPVSALIQSGWCQQRHPAKQPSYNANVSFLFNQNQIKSNCVYCIKTQNEKQNRYQIWKN